MPEYQPDLEIRDSQGKVIAIIEVKGQETITGEGAAQVRRNVLAHSTVPPSPFFAVVTPTTGYLWRTGPSVDSDLSYARLPDATFSTEGVIQRYLPEPRPTRHRNGQHLELVFYQWLTELTNGMLADKSDADEALSKAGLVDAARGGFVDLKIGA
jgi:hypothetical protein